MSTLNIINKIVHQTTHHSHTILSEDLLLENIQNWDSLTALQVMSSIETTLSIKLPIFKFIEATTIGDIRALVDQEVIQNDSQ